ncbi:mRNA-decapping enzyme-like protein [Morella rubra]|uniref:mRNA-decapping enzyme-like protein n=1 Tax=Morella rubra TaxID=262757 RepID=A0A6A1WB33_9ROSI|nr:mRNA-decapping enzyme-like protein [Morella rubra]
MSQTGKLMPNLDQQSTKMLNLTVLQRMDPFIEEILITAAHVTFYEFNIDSNQWSRKDVEGSLFVVKSPFCPVGFMHSYSPFWLRRPNVIIVDAFVVRNTQPRFQFIVMNRRNTDNLVENLLGDFEYEVQVPYLLYRNASQEVNGIWFYNPRECEDVANLFTRILNAYSKVPSKSKVSSNPSEFDELGAVPTMSVMEGPLEPSPSATDAPEDASFRSIFSAATNIGNSALNLANSRQSSQPTYHSSSALPLSSHSPSVVSSATPTPQIQSLSLLASSNQAPLHDTVDPISSSNQVTNLLKPSSFFSPPASSSALVMPPISSSVPTATPLHPPLNLQRPYGTPMLQPFPPPNPPPSLTPISAPPNDVLLISRDKVRDALLMLVQDDQFIDLFYKALLKVVYSGSRNNGSVTFPRIISLNFVNSEKLLSRRLEGWHPLFGSVYAISPVK